MNTPLDKDLVRQPVIRTSSLVHERTEHIPYFEWLRIDRTASLVIVCLALSTSVGAQSNFPYNAHGQQPATSQIAPNFSSGPFCGIYCLYAAARLRGQSFEMAEIEKAEYLSGPLGSSMLDLAHAAEAIGLHTFSLKNLTVDFLRNTNLHIILYVKRDLYTSTDFDHYVLLIRADARTAWILDPPNSVQEIPLSILKRSWSGKGLVVSDEPIAAARVLTNRRSWGNGITGLFAIAFLLVVSILFAQRRSSDGPLTSRPTGDIVLSGVLVITLAGGISIVYHSVFDNGLLTDSDALAMIQELHFPTDIPSVDAVDLRKQMDIGDVILVDARREMDYNSGHIDGAVNIPIDAADIPAIISTIGERSTDSHIVVYCQSSSCPYATVVARRMMNYTKYRNVSIYRGGWVDWNT